MSDIKNLLLQVKAKKQESDKILDATGGRFNIFQVLGVNEYETIHSKILAEFLNPKGSHGMKSRFLELFLNECDLENFEFDCSKAIVKTEAYAPTEDKRGRIDILISSGTKHIIIENKLNAQDQKQQLERYDEWSKKNSSDNRILYLTKDGHEASEQSAEDVEYTVISYPVEIVNWLEKCCLESARFPLVRETIIQYINLIKKYTGGSMTQQATEEIIDLLSKDENIEMAQFISANFRKVKIRKARELFDKTEEIVKKYMAIITKKNRKKKLVIKTSTSAMNWNLCPMYIYICFLARKNQKEKI